MSRSSITPSVAGSMEIPRQPVGEFRLGVRESMAILPGWLQPFITLVTGKPLPNESVRAYLSPSPLTNFFLTIVVLAGIIGGNLYLLAHTLVWGIFALPFTWVIYTGLVRKIQVVFGHHCVHHTFIPGNREVNELMLNILTTVALVQQGEEYRRDHLAHHNRTVFTTKDDADAALILEMGFSPGETRASLWRRLFFCMLSPRLHWTFLSSRFSSNFIRRPLMWRFIALAWFAAITIGLSMMTTWWHVALVVWLPLFILYNISALIQFITEHAWMITEKSPSGLEAYADRCWGRFLGDPCPTPDANGLVYVGQWVKWTAKLIFVHVPIRFGCFVGDLPAHDWHHLCGFKKSDPATWPVGIFSRQAMIDTGNGLGMEDRELWGITSMLNHVFTLLEQAGENVTQEEEIAA